MSNKEKVIEYCKQLSASTQQLAARAIYDLRHQDNKRNYEGILTALESKEPEDWERGGFGLMFDYRFEASIDRKIKFKQEVSKIDVNVFGASLDDDEDEESTVDSRKEEFGG